MAWYLHMPSMSQRFQNVHSLLGPEMVNGLFVSHDLHAMSKLFLAGAIAVMSSSRLIDSHPCILHLEKHDICPDEIM